MKQAFTDQFRAIADPGRREILQLLGRDSLTINALADNFDMSRPAVSRHIKILYSAGLIMIEDVGRERRCTLRKEGFAELQQWMNYFDKFWTGKLDKLDKFLESEKINRPKRRPKP